MAHDNTFEKSTYIIPRPSVDKIHERTLHYHEHIELMIITQGAVTVEIEGENRRVSSGDGVLIFPYMAHSYQEKTVDCRRFCFVFSPNYYGELKDIFFSYKPKTGFFTHKQWSSLLNGNIIKDFEKSYADSGDDTYFIGTHMNVRLLSLIFDILHSCGIENVTHRDYLYRSAVSYCLDNFKNPQLNVSDVAFAIGVSKATLCRLFTERYGGVKNYINQLRVDYARYLLQNTALSIAQIAEKSGFSEISTFYRAYRRSFNEAPTDTHGKRLERLR